MRLAHDKKCKIEKTVLAHPPQVDFSRLAVLACCSFSQTNLAAYAHGHTLAGGGLLPTRHLHFSPNPITTVRTENINILCTTRNRSLDILHRQVSDGYSRGGLTSRRPVLVVLLDHDAVFRNAGKGDRAVFDIRDTTCGTGDGLDANTCCRNVYQYKLVEGI